MYAASLRSHRVSLASLGADISFDEQDKDFSGLLLHKQLKSQPDIEPGVFKLTMS